MSLGVGVDGLEQLGDAARDHHLAVGQRHDRRVPAPEVHRPGLGPRVGGGVEDASVLQTLELDDAEVLGEARVLVVVGAAGGEDAAVGHLDLVGAEQVAVVLGRVGRRAHVAAGVAVGVGAAVVGRRLRPLALAGVGQVDRHDARLVVDGEVAALEHGVHLGALQPGQRAPVQDLAVGQGDRAVRRRQAVLDAARLGDAAAGTGALEAVLPERLRERAHLRRVRRLGPGARTRPSTPARLDQCRQRPAHCSPNRNCQSRRRCVCS